MLFLLTYLCEKTAMISSVSPSTKSNSNEVYKDQTISGFDHISFTSPKELAIIKCTFTNIQNQGNGGAIYAIDYCRFSVENTLFSTCYASGQGGSVYASTSIPPCAWDPVSGQNSD